MVYSTATTGAKRREKIGKGREGGRVESSYLAEFLEREESDRLGGDECGREERGIKECLRTCVAWLAHHERFGRRAAGTPLCAAAPRDVTATRLRRHTYHESATIPRERLAAGPGLSSSAKQHQLGSGLALRAAWRNRGEFSDEPGANRAP